MVLRQTCRGAGGGDRDDNGSVLPLVAVWLAVSVLVMMALVAGVGAAVGRARAQATADGAALAGAGGGSVAAQAVVDRNDGVLERYVERYVARDGEQRLDGEFSGPGWQVNHLGSWGRSTQPAVVVTVVVVVDGSRATAAAERFLTPVGFLNQP